LSAIHTLKTGAGGDKVEDVVESPDELAVGGSSNDLFSRFDAISSGPIMHQSSQLNNVTRSTTR
jgi:hypothetical protein